MAARESRPGEAPGASHLYGAGAPALAEGVRFLTRAALGWFLLHQGWGKVTLELHEGTGAFYQSNSFQGRNPAWLPELIGAPYGYLLPWVELLFGALLALGLWTRVTAAVACLIFVSIAVALWSGGGFFPRHMLMVYIPLAAYFMLTGPGRYSVDAVLARRREVTF